MARRLYRRLRLTFLGVVSIHSYVLVVIHETVRHFRPSFTKKRYGYLICLEKSNLFILKRNTFLVMEYIESPIQPQVDIIVITLQ